MENITINPVDGLIASMTFRLQNNDYSRLTRLEEEQIHEYDATTDAQGRNHATVILGQWLTEKLRRFVLGEWEHNTSHTDGEAEISNVPSCVCCLDEIQSRAWITLSSCEHEWCQECLERNFEQAMRSRASWPPRCCDKFTEHDLEQVEHLISEELSEKWKAKNEELSAHNPTYCPRTKCQAFIPAHGNDQFAICHLCKWTVCHRCKYSIPEHTAAPLKCPSRIGAENEKLLAEGAMQQCPRCQCLVEKSEGCDHMVCQQCYADFCYRCGDPLEEPFYRCRPECGGGAPEFLDAEDEDFIDPEEDIIDDFDDEDIIYSDSDEVDDNADEQDDEEDDDDNDSDQGESDVPLGESVVDLTISITDADAHEDDEDAAGSDTETFLRLRALM